MSYPNAVFCLEGAKVFGEGQKERHIFHRLWEMWKTVTDGVLACATKKMSF